MKNLFRDALQQVMEVELEETLGYEKSERMEDKILGLYACGMNQRDIAEQSKSLYDVEISPELVSKISEKIMPEVIAWQSCPLESVYPFVFMDAIHYKIKENHQYIAKAAYVVLGIRLDGRKGILGVWIGKNESSKFWLSVLNDLKNRGVQDIIHQIRSSTRYVSYKDSFS